MCLSQRLDIASFISSVGFYSPYFSISSTPDKIYTYSGEYDSATDSPGSPSPMTGDKCTVQAFGPSSAADGLVDADGDVCLDVTTALEAPLAFAESFNIPCTDYTDGLQEGTRTVKLQFCSTWRNPGDIASCDPLGPIPGDGSTCWCETIDLGVEIKPVEEAVPTCAPNLESASDQPTQAPQAEVVVPASEAPTPAPFAIIIDTPAPTVVQAPTAVDGGPAELEPTYSPTRIDMQLTGSPVESGVPMAIDDSLTTCSGVSAGKNVISNDVAEKGFPLLVKQVIPEASGMNGLCYVKLDQKTVQYYPFPGFDGIDYCDYVACDGLDRCETARIRIRVNAAGEGDCPETEQPSARPTPSPTPDPTPSP